MPTISRFFGITIRMYFDDHAPPHFHAYYGNESALFEIETLKIQSGEINRRAMILVLEWAMMHREELLQNWKKAEAHEALTPISPLE